MASPVRNAAAQGAKPPPAAGRSPEGEILELVPGAIVHLDARGYVTYLNAEAELRLGVPRADALGRDFFRDLLPTLEAGGWGERFRDAVRAGFGTLEAEADRPDGGSLGVTVRAFEGDAGAEALALLEDRTALSVERARRRHAEQMAAAGEIAAGMAHEINNPLAAIKGFAQFLHYEGASDTVGQAAQAIDAETTRIARLVNDLLRLADDHLAQIEGPVDLLAVVGEMLRVRRYALESSGVEIREDFPQRLSPVFGRAGALQRLVLTVLKRAEMALLESEKERVLSVCARESSDGVVLYVSDSGAGLAPESLAFLFAPTRDVSAGDLAGALETAREHGGHLWAESEEGRGTTYCLRLPRWSADPGAHHPARPTATVRPLRVLVADDEPTLRLALKLYLGQRGHEVVEARDAQEAARLAGEEPFDVVLADARMPGDGVHLLEKLEASPALRGRTILMTGDPSHPAVAKLVESGRPLLEKPFDMSAAVALVESVAP